MNEAQCVQAKCTSNNVSGCHGAKKAILRELRIH